MYHVWRRDDGYVGASNTKFPWGSKKKKGELTLLKTFEEWPDARNLIAIERNTPAHRALVASWNEDSD